MNKLKSLTAPIILILIILASFALMFNASSQESAIMDELAHIPAGYGYDKYFDYRLNPEHPPLVKALAALPLIFQNLSFPTNSQYWQKDVNGQWAAGTQFLYESGNNADKIIDWARVFPMILTIVLILFVYIWANELLGKWWAFLPTLLVAFSPTFLAQGHYVTTDIGATLGIFTSIYYFSKFINEKSGKYLAFSGIAFGLAQLMKFSAVLLIPLFGFLIFIYAISKARNYDLGFGAKLLGFVKEFFKYLGYLIAIFTIGYLVVYAVYFLFTINYPIEKQVSDTTFTLTSFGKGPDQNFQSCKIKSLDPMTCLADADIWMAGNKVFRPIGEYLLGVLMVLQRASGGNTSYFLGEVSNTGWWYYFPVVFALKEPIPSLLLITLTFLIAGFKFLRNPDNISIKRRFFNYLELNFAEFSMFSFVFLYWAYSIKSPLNIGVRHVLPTLPLIYILSSGTIKNWVRHKITLSDNFIKNTLYTTTNIIKISVKTALIFILVIWFILESLINIPYFISYFNEFAGGTMNGYKYVTDSNYDWGQDMRRLKIFVADKKIDKIAVDYFGGGNPQYYLGDASTPLSTGKAILWQSSKGNPKYDGINWIAISINTLQSATGKLHAGQTRNSEDEYQWLQKVKDIHNPDYRVGTSIFVYKLN